MSTVEHIAALPMYDLPPIAQAHDALWNWLAQHLSQSGVSKVPRALSRHLSHTDSWRHSGLLLGQGCEYPLAISFADQVQLIATPCYSAQGCEGSAYRSAFVVRATDSAEHLQDLRGKRCAVNDVSSNSGMNLLRAAVAPLADSRSFFSAVALSGSHFRSIEMVASGLADLAAIDCVSWAHFGRHYPAVTCGLRVLDWSARSPALPFITALATDERCVAALAAAFADLRTDSTLGEVRRQLLLEDVEPYGGQPFAAVLQMQRDAAALNYTFLH